MATIHCKACGASYHYEKEGCCPKCGAYNRPPKRERVNADGTVQHMTDAAYEKRQHAQGKVCFEEKECYEDQARTGVKKQSGAHAASADSFDRVQSAAAVQTARKASGKKSVGRRAILIVLALLGAFGGGLIENYLDRDKTPAFEPEPEVIVEPADVDLSWANAAMGEELTLVDGSVLTVRAVGVDDDRISLYLETDFADSDHTVYPVLACLDRRGDEVYLDDFTTEWDEDIILHFSTDGWTDLEPLYLSLEEWDDQDDLNTWYIALR